MGERERERQRQRARDIEWVGTFVRREICGTDSSCLPTTVSQVVAPKRGAKEELRLQQQEAARRGTGKWEKQQRRQQSRAQHKREPAAGHF